MSALGDPPSIIHSVDVVSSILTATWNQACGLTISIFTTVPRNFTGLLTSNSAANAWWANSGSVRTSAPRTAGANVLILGIASLIILLRPGRLRQPKETRRLLGGGQA